MQIGSGTESRLAGTEDLAEIGRFLADLGGPEFIHRYPGVPVGEFYRWKYFGSPYGPAIIAVATDGARIVSTVAAVPRLLHHRGQSLPVYELGDFLTASRYRGRGLFSALIERVKVEAAARGAVLLYVRPNDVSFPILSGRLGFLEILQMDSRRLVFPADVLSRRTGIPAGFFRLTGADACVRNWALPHSVPGIAVERITRFDSEMDEFWREAAPVSGLVFQRDSAYLNWRYADCPTPYSMWVARREHRVCGFAAAFAGQHPAYFMDLFTRPADSDAAKTLTGVCFERTLQGGVRGIYTWTVRGSSSQAMDAVLRRACPFREDPPLHFAVKLLARAPSGEELRAGPWHLSLGDFDGF